MKMKTKKVLVTGACGGMGSAICALLLQKGYEVYGIDCKVTAAEESERFHFLPCDITDMASVENAFAKVKATAGKLDALIHTAGIYDLDSLLEMSEQRFLRILNVNLCGVYRVNKLFLPLLEKGGRILITTSELAPLDPLPFTGLYAISKAALEKYAYSLRMEVALLGISVSVIRPGAVKTGLLNDSTAALDRFCATTQLYRCNAAKFRKIVDSVETKNVSPDVIAATVLRTLEARSPNYVYNVNRNLLLRLFGILPSRMQVPMIRRILKTK